MRGLRASGIGSRPTVSRWHSNIRVGRLPRRIQASRLGRSGSTSYISTSAPAARAQIGDVIRQFGLAGSALEAGVDAVDGDQTGECFNDGISDGQTSRCEPTGESGIRPAAGCMGRRNGDLARNKSFFQKTLEARRGDFWLGRRRARAGPATGGSGCGAGGRGCGRAMWRGLGREAGWRGEVGAEMAGQRRLGRIFWRIGDEGWGCEGTAGRRWGRWVRGGGEGLGRRRLDRKRRGSGRFRDKVRNKRGRRRGARRARSGRSGRSGRRRTSMEGPGVWAWDRVSPVYTK